MKHIVSFIIKDDTLYCITMVNGVYEIVFVLYLSYINFTEVQYVRRSQDPRD